MLKINLVTAHLARGIIGFGLLAAGLFYSASWGWWTLVPLAAALVFLGGCPTCWIATMMAIILRRKDGMRCIDGSCELDRNPAPSAPIAGQ